MKLMPMVCTAASLALFCLERSAAQAVPVSPGSEAQLAATKNSCSEKDIFHYTARRASAPIKVDGVPDEADWQTAEKSPRFVDMATGEAAIYGTHAAALWDDQNLYLAYWIEEPLVQAKMTQKNSLIFNESDAEVFIDGGDTYYEFETNARGTTYQMFYIWRDAFKKGGKFDVPEWDPVEKKALVFGGDYDRQAPFFWKGTNPRGLRWTYFGWEFPGMQSAVHVDGTLNDNSDVDKGWTVELVFPWKGAKWLAGDRQLPPKDGDVWKIFFGRFELLRVAGQEVQPHPGWAMNKHGVYDTHLPQCWTAVEFKK
ncbi:MAG TPA: carbohydrate-binding family 9-like protein [Candidatus Acidoferrum sp.]|nr:carbohydrate-binding family 9-like protein [Candidatus Acidoferrum sp.]